jgi:flagellar biosynthesis protein FlhB
LSDKTEAPTARRKSEARDEGRVARSQELNSAAALLIGAWLLKNFGGKMVVELENIIYTSISTMSNTVPTTDQLQFTLVNDILRLLPNLGFILVGLLATGLSITWAQTGLLWAKKRIGFDFNRLNPISGFKRLFSMNGVVELIKAILKLAVVGWVAYSFLRAHLPDILALAQTDIRSGVAQWVSLALTLMMNIATTFFVVAVIDYSYQRWQFTRSMKMTKEEVKEDMKRSEGDPFIKSRIRSQQRRMARMRMMANVPKADVVITNPTHLAVAINYHSEEMTAPKVLAKGAHHVAERIVAIARENDIPVIQNIPVARALYRTVEVDQEIPPELYTAIAEVLAFVYRQRRPSSPLVQGFTS